MPLNDVSALKIELCKDSIPSHRIKTTLNFLQDNTPDSISLQKRTSHSADLTELNYLVWDVLQELVYEERRKQFCELQRSSECYQRQMA